MSRPELLVLPADTSGHRSVPMPGSQHELALRRLASHPEGFVIHGVFPRGFARTEPGGYRVAEEFLVLEGTMRFDGVDYGPGTLVAVSAHLLRKGMSAPEGCTVLAWFSGPAEFVPAAELREASSELTVAVDLLSSAAGVVLETPQSCWRRVPAGEPLPEGDGDVLAADLRSWRRRDRSSDPIAEDRIVRIEGH